MFSKETMKGVACVFLVSLLVSLLFSQSISARLLPTSYDESDSLVKIQEDDMAKLLGLEECHQNNEACLKRRMVAEAHLDYIYTQHHNPKRIP